MVVIEIDDKTEQAQKVIEMLHTFPFVSVKDKKVVNSPYNKEYVKKIRKREKTIKAGKTITLTNELRNKLFS